MHAATPESWGRLPIGLGDAGSTSPRPKRRQLVTLHSPARASSRRHGRPATHGRGACRERGVEAVDLLELDIVGADEAILGPNTSSISIVRIAHATSAAIRRCAALVSPVTQPVIEPTGTRQIPGRGLGARRPPSAHSVIRVLTMGWRRCTAHGRGRFPARPSALMGARGRTRPRRCRVALRRRPSGRPPPACIRRSRRRRHSRRSR